MDELAARARADRVARHSSKVWVYHVGRLEFANVCINACRHCDYLSSPDDPGAVVLSPDAVAARARQLASLGIDRLQVVGGARIDMPVGYYIDIAQAAREALPSLRLELFSPSHIHELARRDGVGVGEVIDRLADAGIDWITGDGGEVINSRARRVLCWAKLSGGTWLYVMHEAHKRGIRSSVSMVFGHREAPGEKAEHLALVRDIQDETGGFEAYWPEPLSNGFRTRGSGECAEPAELLRELAVGRLMLDNFAHIRCVTGPASSPQLAPRAAACGADEVYWLTRFRADDDEPPSVALLDATIACLDDAGWQVVRPS